MKQMNVLIDDELSSYLEKWSLIESYNTNKKVPVSDVVRRAIENYTRFREVDLNIELFDNGRIKKIGYEKVSEEYETDADDPVGDVLKKIKFSNSINQ